ncbi:hypothetical protein M8818_002544 [Zalaria obscura]|uniref:Uncharacterized protein n=1 Tax=Zalaria obscura TaxID=2024903 RepID=A0ACC3SGU1_9PEZI
MSCIFLPEAKILLCAARPPSVEELEALPEIHRQEARPGCYLGIIYPDLEYGDISSTCVEPTLPPRLAYRPTIGLQYGIHVLLFVDRCVPGEWHRDSTRCLPQYGGVNIPPDSTYSVPAGGLHGFQRDRAARNGAGVRFRLIGAPPHGSRYIIHPKSPRVVQGLSHSQNYEYLHKLCANASQINPLPGVIRPNQLL